MSHVNCKEDQFKMLLHGGYEFPYTRNEIPLSYSPEGFIDEDYLLMCHAKRNAKRYSNSPKSDNGLVEYHPVCREERRIQRQKRLDSRVPELHKYQARIKSDQVEESFVKDYVFSLLFVASVIVFLILKCLISCL